MRTYKQKYQQAIASYEAERKAKSELFGEYLKLVNNLLENKTIENTTLLNYLVDGLQDIRKNGGAYSSVKAVELLLALGKLE